MRKCKKKYYIEDRPTDRPTDDRRPTDFLIWPILGKGSSDPLHVWFYGGVFGVDGSNGANTGKPRDAASVTMSKFKV